MKRFGILLLQLLITAAGLFYVFHGAQTRQQAMAAVEHAQWSWLLAGWCCYAIVEILATVRWQILLRIQGITLGWLRAWSIVVLGLFLNMFLPGLVGGDAMRLFVVFKNSPRQKTEATLSIAMDRLLGLISILFLAVLAVVVRFRWLTSFPETKDIFYIALIVLAAGAGVIGLLFVVTGAGRAGRLPREVPFRKWISRGAGALNLYRRQPALIGGTLLLTIFSHLAYYLSYYAAMRSLTGGGVRRPSLLDFFCVMPLVNTLTGVPVSFGGAGIRETLFQTFFSRLSGMPVAIAAFTASLGFVIQASWGIVGAVSYWIMRPARR